MVNGNERTELKLLQQRRVESSTKQSCLSCTHKVSDSETDPGVVGAQSGHTSVYHFETLACDNSWKIWEETGGHVIPEPGDLLIWLIKGEVLLFII